MHAVHRLNVGGLEGLSPSPFGLRYSRTPLKGGLREKFCLSEGELAGAQVILCNANCLRAKYASEQENRGEPAEGSLNLSCKHREPTYALSQAAVPLEEFPL